MKVRAAITWVGSLSQLRHWCALPVGDDTDPELRLWFDAALEAAVEYLEDRDFQRREPPNTWTPGVGETVPEDQVVTDLPVPSKVALGVFEYVRAARALKARAGGEGVGLTGGGTLGVTESYTAASAASVHQGALAAAIPFWEPYKLPTRRGRLP